MKHHIMAAVAALTLAMGAQAAHADPLGAGLFAGVGYDNASITVKPGMGGDTGTINSPTMAAFIGAKAPTGIDGLNVSLEYKHAFAGASRAYANHTPQSGGGYDNSIGHLTRADSVKLNLSYDITPHFDLYAGPTYTSANVKLSHANYWGGAYQGTVVDSINVHSFGFDAGADYSFENGVSLGVNYAQLANNSLLKVSTLGLNVAYHF